MYDHEGLFSVLFIDHRIRENPVYKTVVNVCVSMKERAHSYSRPPTRPILGGLADFSVITEPQRLSGEHLPR